MNNFLELSYKGISGVTVIDSGVPGKNIAILAVTHGNESVGIQVFEYLLGEYSPLDSITFFLTFLFNRYIIYVIRFFNLLFLKLCL